MEDLYHFTIAGGISASTYILVFIVGIVSAVLACYLPVLAMFANYVQKGAAGDKRKAIRIALNFILGMVVTSVLTGLIIALLGQQFLPFVEKYNLLTWVPPVFDILAGLQLIGVISFAMPTFQKSLSRPELGQSNFAAFKLGIPYGLVISPCAIPIFFALISYIALQGSPLHGALLMTTYSLGKGVILVAVAVFSISILSKLARWGGLVRKVAGYLSIAIGIIFLVIGFIKTDH
ncbi:cytochrome c biogenesis CcdA family protein [Paenibacillus chondroitinus]|uniref:Cytochrome c biogenesis CcdA family protein n=1 Tax=Paenibacillus chondroitinus TaxID=59842 RepID=A0ABU6D3Z3_9BACL|nr:MULTISPECIES: cytochrome c biogenesis CcdA family protein [Paenibacillus]MCY9660759.1 cytochrome c biogenesis CcdA family protein [Paenibacillus anseongense]MEB4792443.1 cytochrome c biogenesis CcdA family protein [Paenibacillus chondroitinus]